jgi:hypothetical protein
MTEIDNITPLYVNFGLEGASTVLRNNATGEVIEVPGGPIIVVGDKDTSDGHHTFAELYRYRLLYNAALFNEWAKLGLYDPHKSMFHDDGTLPFGDRKWFIVVAELPTGQISNHYRVVDWDLFDIPTKDLPNVYDGHSPDDVERRLTRFLTKSDDDRFLPDSTLVGWGKTLLEQEI